MITTTLQKERQRNRRSRIFQAIVPMLAFLVSLGTWQSAKAQTVQFFNDAINLTVQQTGGNTLPVGYAGKARSADAPYNSYTKLGNAATGVANPQLGTFDLVNTSQLTLSGGSLVIRPLPDDDGDLYAVTAARLQYRVYLKTATTLPAFTALPFPTATPVSAPAGATRYSGASSSNLLSGLSVGGQYVIEVRFEVATSSPINGNNLDTDTQGASTYQAEFTLTAPPAPTLKGTAVYVTPNAGPNANTQLTYSVNATTTPPPAFVGANLGGAGVTYDINTGQLTLNGGMATTTEAGTSNVTNVVLNYRVRLQGTGGAGFTAINLSQTNNSNGTRTFGTNSSTINLINAASITGSYSVDVYYVASGTNSNGNFTIQDGSPTTPYTATFTVTGTAIPSTTWTGGLNDNWFENANWSNGVPTAGTNVTIANLGTGSINPYPRIFCNTTYVYTNSSNQQTTTINNGNSGLALARNLTMAGNSQSDASKLGLVVGTLNVGGDFDNRYGSFGASDGTTTAFIGTNQTISGGIFANVSIEGGGVKSLQASMTITSDLIFVNGLLATDVTQPLISIVTLNDRSLINGNLGGRLVTESDNAYLRGLVTITHRTITLGTEDTFGNIGLALTYSTAPGEVTITRNTAAAYAPGNGVASGVRRIFDVSQPAADPSSVLRASVRFSYLDNETKNLGANGNININESDLTLYVTTNKGNTFTDLGRTSINTGTNNLIDNNVTAFAIPATTFTLGDRTNPLPVELTSFDAKRSGTNALITWATASEKNSAGFEVQVSTDGVAFKKLAFVASASANSSANQVYSYTDAETAKTGVRYYRLRQVDIDGQYAYSPTRAVSFAAATGAMAALSAYPSPFTTSDQAALVLQAPTAGPVQLQLMDMMGRTLVNRELTTVAGISEIPVPNASDLAVGSYLVKVTFATGEVKTLRIQKK
jgi:hypothetical protein